MQIGTIDALPFLLGTAAVSGELLERAPGADVRFVDATAPQNAVFFRLLNAGNALAYGGLGMPDWVQLDCCTLPSVMAGFALRRRDLDPALVRALLHGYERRFGAAGELADDDWIPVSEYCALPTPTPGLVIGVSLFSLVRGLGLGLRSKALGLLVLRATRQLGVTQRHSHGERAHRRLGALRVVRDRLPVHPRAADSYLYELQVPAQEQLLHVYLHGAAPAPQGGTGPGTA